MSANTFTPGPTPNTVRAADGRVLTAPEGWVLLPPGDAALTRRVKAAGAHWVVAEKKGRKVFSRGVWAAAATIKRILAALDAERSTEGFAKKKEADARRREKAQVEYVGDFLGTVVKFLAFHPSHADLADRLARAVTAHATPVGSGTVARTKRIPVEQRAEAAVIAWMRRQTTGYDSLVIPRVKGKRREARRMLARRSHKLLERYRRGEPVGEECPLMKALGSGPGASVCDKICTEQLGGPTMLEGCKNISFGIPNHKEKVRAGQVKAVVCETERDLDDWFRDNLGSRPALPVDLPIGILDEIQIIPAQWGKGLATPALKHCIGLCTKHSCTGIILNSVPQINCPIDLDAWYQRHGFKIIGQSGLGRYMLLELPPGNSISESDATPISPKLVK